MRAIPSYTHKDTKARAHTIQYLYSTLYSKSTPKPTRKRCTHLRCHDSGTSCINASARSPCTKRAYVYNKQRTHTDRVMLWWVFAVMTVSLSPLFPPLTTTHTYKSKKGRQLAGVMISNRRASKRARMISAAVLSSQLARSVQNTSSSHIIGSCPL